MTRLGSAGAVLAGCVAAAMLSSTPAFADTGPDPGDPRAQAFSGNATTCEDAGLAGTQVEVEFVSDGTFVTITSVPEGISLTGTVIKGGPAYNVYPGDVRTDMHSPINEGGNIPQISHWYACGVPDDGPTPTPTPTMTPSQTPEPTATPTASASPVPSPPGAEDDGNLAQTGFNSEVGLAVAALLLGVGMVLLGVPRRLAVAVRRRHHRD